MPPRRKQRNINNGSNNSGWSDSGSTGSYSKAPESDSDEDYTENRRPTKRAKRLLQSGKKQPEPKGTQIKARTKASIVSLATDSLYNQESASDRLSKVDSAVLTRIKKALALANHANTGEQEAKAALRMAAKLMSQHSISQADVLAEEDEVARMKRAGMSIVSIKSLFDSAVRLESWISTVAQAMSVFFDCKSYSTTFSGGTRLEWTFYGLAEQTVAAAYAFEMVYNLVLEWSQAKHAGQGRREKTTYRIGVGDGLYSLAKQDKKEEQQRAVDLEKRRLEAACKAEEEEGQARLKRLEHPNIPGDSPLKSQAVKDNAEISPKSRAMDTKVKVEEVEDEDTIHELPSGFAVLLKDEDNHASLVDDQPANPEDNFGSPSSITADGPAFQPDFDDSDDDINLLDLDAVELKYRPQPRTGVRELNDIVGPSNINGSPALAPTQEKDEDQEAEWKSVRQLVAFRDTSVAIADEWLKTQNVKLKKGRKPKVRTLQNQRETQLYKQGKEDAKKIDVRRKRIKDKEDDY